MNPQNTQSKMKNMILAAVFLTGTAFAQSGVNESRAPLTKQGTVLEEGRNLIMPSESYPREPGKLAGPVTLQPVKGGIEISFTLTSADDVEVAVIDAEGKALRILGCGLVGTDNAPEPFKAGSLSQTLLWDGKDSQGNAVTGNWQIRVSVGFEAKFDQFVGYDPSQVSQYVCGMEVDPQGRVYVALHTDNHGDYSVLRFNRNGSYADQVHPPSPEGHTLESMQEHWPYSRMIDGEPVPSRLHAEQFWIWRWTGWQPFPLKVSRDGKAYVFETDTHWWNGGFHSPEGFRLWKIEDLERFWFTPKGMALFGRTGGIALDDKGGAYLASRTREQTMKSLPSRGYDNKDALARIRKIDLAAEKQVPQFTWNGTEKLEAPSPYLGSKHLVKELPTFEQREADPAIDSENHFIDICGLDVDSDGNLYVMDGFPRRIKMYSPEGKWLGQVASVKIDGNEETFWNLTGIRHSKNAVFFIATLYKDKGESAVLVKMKADPANPEIIWTQPLNGAARYVAVDDFSDQTLLWVGNGNGPYTFSCIEDSGAAPGRIRHFSGLKPGTFVQPLEVAALGNNELAVFDFGRKKIVKTNTDGSVWKEVEVPVWEEREAFLKDMLSERYRPYEYDPGQISSMKYDHVNGRLLVGYGRYQYSPQFQAYDRDMNLLDFQLEKAGGNRFFSTEGWGVNFAGTDADGNLYVYDKLASMNEQRIRPLSWNKGWFGGKYGAIRKYGPDGKILDEVVRLYHPCGSVALDSKQNIYAIDMAKSSYENSVFYFPHYKDSYEFYEGYENKAHFQRGGEDILHQSDITYLVKFGPEGGERNEPSEIWAHRGVGTHPSEGCYCDMPSNLLTVDIADRIYAADGVNYTVKVFDTAGNLLAKIGGYGNADTRPGTDGSGKVGFRNLHAMDSDGEALYVSDKDLNRVAKFKAAYREVAVTSP